jgi:hypothetical protein
LRGATRFERGFPCNQQRRLTRIVKSTDSELDLRDLMIQEADTFPATAASQPGGEPIRLTPQEFNWVSVLSRHYRKHFGQRMDVEQFVANDIYARVVLQQSHSSGNAALAALAAQFLDETGRPRFALGKGSGGVDLEF